MILPGGELHKSRPAGSRSGPLEGGAAMQARRKMRERLDVYAAHMLEAAVEDIAWEHGPAHVRGVYARHVSLRDIARIAYNDVRQIPSGLPIGLEVTERYQPPRPVSFSNMHPKMSQVGI